MLCAAGKQDSVARSLDPKAARLGVCPLLLVSATDGIIVDKQRTELGRLTQYCLKLLLFEIV